MEKNPRIVKVHVYSLVVWALLLVVIQLLISQYTVKVAGNREVIDYVSFAGTVVGMILAILAIVYSFIANASQRDDSIALRSGITSLNEAIARAQASGSQFSDEVEKLEFIRERIAFLVSNSQASLESTNRVEEYLRNFRVKEEQLGAAPAPQAVGGAFLDSIASHIAGVATSLQVAVYYLAFVEDEKGDLKDRVYPKLFKTADKSSWQWFWYDGQIFANYFLLYDFDIRRGEEVSPRGRLFLRALLARGDELLARADAGLKDPWAEALRTIKGAISEKLAALDNPSTE